jgi:RNA polymerase sigma factor (sigma-70 family)
LVRPAPDTDRELVDRVRDGDTGAYAELWRRHRSAARSLGRQLSHSADEADDLVAEAFARVLRAIRHGAGPTESFRPYLMTAVRRTWWRRCADRPIALDEEREVEAVGLDEPDLDDAGFDGEVGRAFRSLPPRWQNALWLADIQGHSSAEVGERLGLSPNAAAALLNRARHGLRRAYFGTSAPTAA